LANMSMRLHVKGDLTRGMSKKDFAKKYIEVKVISVHKRWNGGKLFR
jgi:hypothetical protein